MSFRKLKIRSHLLHSAFLLLPIVLLLGATTSAHGKDLVVSAAQLTSTNVVAKTTRVRFSISWNNAWRYGSGPTNWDAAWVFVKYQVKATGQWHHARLALTGHTTPQGISCTPGTNGSAVPAATTADGVFIHFANNGTGPLSAKAAELVWNYASAGISIDKVAQVKVFAVEMVYVPQGPFELGGFGEAAVSLNGQGNPFPVASEDKITVAEQLPTLKYVAGPGDDGLGPIPAEFPKGFKGFYCMKYELQQKQYVDFLNTLTRDQQAARVASDIARGKTTVKNRYVMSNTDVLQARNGIRCNEQINATAPVDFYCDLNGNGIANEANDGLLVAANYLNWGDMGSYLDWACLRPMTELEFEKACRGAAPAVVKEFAWGTVGRVSAANVTNPGTVLEATSTAGANVVSYGVPDLKGPMRTGSFEKVNETRARTGTSFYGIFDLSGNVFERTITIGTPAGRAFAGTHGDGSLDAMALQNVTSWPLHNAPGAGIRGGGWVSQDDLLRVSNRSMSAAQQGVVDRNIDKGGRGVRTAP